jgi:hypothetical protein
MTNKKTNSAFTTILKSFLYLISLPKKKQPASKMAAMTSILTKKNIGIKKYPKYSIFF